MKKNFNPAEHPICFDNPKYLSGHSAWVEHIPFAFAIISMLQPKVLVELGTHYGDSYCAFCQAVEALKLPTKCYAVDTWYGDDHTTSYGPEVLQFLKQHHDKHYSAFSTLLQSTFDAAEAYFQEEGIDLLHIDGFHTYDAVKHDFESWLPKLSDKGVILFHDTNVRERGFGVWRLWEELREQYPHYEFSHGHGLGVLAVGSSIPEYLQSMLVLPTEDQAIPALFYSRLGSVLTRESQILSEIATCKCMVSERDGQILQLEQTISEREGQILQIEQILSERDGQVLQLEQTVSDRDAQISQLEQIVSAKDGHISQIEQIISARDEQISDLYGSTSWQYTAPLRWCGTQVHRAKRVRRVLSAVNEHSGGFNETLSKAVRVYRREGLAGVRSRVSFFVKKEVSEPPSSCDHSYLKSARNNKYVTPHTERVDIIVCVHNALDDVARCLESIISQTHPSYSLIIVDDGSGAETKSYLEEFAAGQQCTLIRHEKAKGYTCAANVGLRASTGEFMILLNSDTVVPPRWLDRLIECANSDENIGLVGPLSNTASWQSVPLLMDFDGDWAENPLPDGWTVADYANEVARVSPRVYPRVGFLNGFCLLIRREVIQDIGLFDEETFGRGYGEENDYCLRATDRGWQLAVSDDCYVYHAQSKSYSNERRAELCKIADEGLAGKHGHARIGANLRITKDHLALKYMRKRCDILVQDLDIRHNVNSQYEGKRILFLLPVGNAGGGGNIVLLEAQMLRELGVDVWIANLELNRELFEQDHPDIDVPVIYLRSPDDLPAIAETFDAVIATLYLTVYWMKPLAYLINKPVLGYYIQDFEPDFFAQGSKDYVKAFDSYTAIDGLKLFTKTAWNCQMIERQIGIRPRIVGPSFNVDIHHPQPSASQHNNAVRVLAMVRPSTPRRAPEMTLKVLKRLSRHFGNRIVIEIFGVNADDRALHGFSLDFNHQMLGTLDNERVSTVLSRTDLFLDCSTFQAMGLTAMEAMGHGAVVIGPKAGGLSEIITDGHDGILVNTEDEEEIFTAACKVIEDSKLFNHLRRNTLDVLAYSPLHSATEIMNTLFAEQGRGIETDSISAAGGDDA